MIFSLENATASVELRPSPRADVFCFFHVEKSVSCPIENIDSAICASLRLKKEVLILDSKLKAWPRPDETKRWQSGDGWIWLSPRFLSDFKLLAKNLGTTFVSIQTSLTSCKP